MMNEQVTAFIDAAPEEQKEIMKAVRQLIHGTVKGVREEFKWSRPVFKKEKDFAYLKPAKAYVSLGFFQFRNLNDPDGLLEGTGKDMRHIKLRKAKDINEELLKEWLAASAK